MIGREVTVGALFFGHVHVNGLRRGPRFVRIGSRIFYSRAEIERYIEKNRVDTDSRLIVAAERAAR